MSTANKSVLIIVFVVIITAVSTYLLTRQQLESVYGQPTELEQTQQTPLYWVAPMDPNYRKDEPGKSPMGMDLIPVYENTDTATDAGAGVVTISPDVVNNIGVRTAIAEWRPLPAEITTVGYVKYDEDSLVHIHPRVEGWIEQLYVKTAGDPVQKGQALYSLYSPELVNAQEELVLALNRDNTRLVKAAEYRLQALQIDTAVIRQLKQTRKVKQALTFYAPQSGVIDNLSIREGFYVKPGLTLMSIGDLSNVWVEAEIFERQAEQVKVGLPVTMTLDYMPGRKWQGHVDYVYPTLDKITRTLRVRLRFDNDDNLLKPNMFAQVTIHADDYDEKLVIPSEALIRTGNENRVVLALGDGQYKSVAVTVGRVTEHFAEIKYGIKSGDEVVSSAQFLLDSESSKTSDFKRLHHQDTEPDSVWTQGEIKDVMLDHRMVTVSHQAISEWNWPDMTMDFFVSNKVDITTLTKGRHLQMEVSKALGKRYEIIDVKLPKSDDNTDKTDRNK